MPSTQLIYRDVPGPLPATSTIDPALEIVVSSVFARFDGSGAAGSFVPCLDILSQDGKIISRVAVSSQTLAPGDLARVTWAPFLRRLAAATPAGGGVVSLAKLDVDNFAVGPGFTPIVFTNIKDGLAASGAITLNGAGNCELTEGGIYFFDLVSMGVVLPVNQNTEVDFQFDVTSGSVGLWSTNLNGGNEASGARVPRIDSAANISSLPYNPASFKAFAGWSATDTFPVEITVQLDYRIDDVSTAQTPDVRLTVIRFGAADE